MVKEYLEGVALLEYWKKVKRKDRLEKLKEICNGLFTCLSVLETAGIIHADLKPGNILIEEDKNDLKVKLIDFGLSFYLNNIPKRKTLFALGYSSPELILNRLNKINPSTDLFSVGVILHQLIEGEMPLINANPSITTNLQLIYPLPNLSRKWSELNTIIQKMTVKPAFKKPPNRYTLEKVDELILLAQTKRYKDLKNWITEVMSVRLKPWYK